MDVLKRAADAIGRMWANFNSTQKIFAGFVAAFLVFLFVWGTVGGTGDSMVRVIGHDVDSQTRDEVLRKLREKSEKFEERADGIYLPREAADRVVSELAAEGVMTDRAVWDWLKSNDIFVTNWQLEKRYQLALQRKLEMMIRKIDGVRNASVLLSPGTENQQFFREGAKASASVQVELRPSVSFGNKQARAVAGLVARAVPGLDTDRVLITDNLGQSYRIPHEAGDMVMSGDMRDLEVRLEEDIKAKIKELFPNASVGVRVATKRVDVRTTEKKFGKQVPRIEDDRKSVGKPGQGVAAGGIKGGTDLTEKAPASAALEQETSSHVENLVDEVIREMKDPAGSIEKVTVGVLIPQDSDAKSALTLEQARSVIARSAGIPLDDNILAVHFVPVKKPEAIPAAAPPAEKATDWFFSNWATIALVILALLALLFIYKIIRAAIPTGTVEAIESLSAQLSQPAEGDEGPPALTATDSAARVKQGVQDVISRNPAAAAAGLKQWMSEAR